MKRRRLPPGDPVLAFAIGILIMLGCVMVFSSSAILANNRFGDPYVYIRRHMSFLFVGLGLLYLSSRMKTEIWRKSWLILYLATLAGLAATFMMGKSLSGARRWLYLGPIGFQVSELAKLVLVVALARYLDRYHSRLTRWRWALVYPTLMFGLLIVPIALQPDFGNPFVMMLGFFSMLLIAGISWKHLAVYPLMALPAMAALIVKSPYRIKRFLSFFSLWKADDIAVQHGAAYQASQALLALGSGGLFGKGLGDSDLKLHYLPQPHTDFVFPVIGEELGFAGSMAVVILFSLIAIRGIKAAINAERAFDRSLAAGLTLMLVFQAGIHMAVTTALAPTKGITLPFISYGGSSLLMSCLMAGILLRISRSRNA
ncbi:MAG: putative lipid II flippase FtsW [Elusimicrobia bacterium]|nr:putative lipid II flippase FtsW [Elusimicrobiota bacterium]